MVNKPVPISGVTFSFLCNLVWFLWDETEITRKISLEKVFMCYFLYLKEERGFSRSKAKVLHFFPIKHPLWLQYNCATWPTKSKSFCSDLIHLHSFLSVVLQSPLTAAAFHVRQRGRGLSGSWKNAQQAHFYSLLPNTESKGQGQCCKIQPKLLIAII